MSRRLTQIRGRVKKPLMFGQGETVGRRSDENGIRALLLHKESIRKAWRVPPQLRDVHPACALIA
jgi:hypothetical protein